jgi:hypothetical protein
MDVELPGMPGVFWDERLLRNVSAIERSIVRLRLDSQGEFVALFNAIEMQLESGDPQPKVVRLLCDALLELADSRGLDRKKLKLDSRLDNLNTKLAQSLAKFHRARRSAAATR